MGTATFWWRWGLADIPKGFKATLDGNPEDLRTSVEGFLDQIGAKGHRHFVRFGNHYASIATFGFQRDGKRYAGVVHDISAVGISCTFKPEPDQVGHMIVHDMQLNLPGYRAVIPGTFHQNEICRRAYNPCVSFRR
jgi:hypothetical protein